MSAVVVGLWLNGMPSDVLKEDSDIKHICKLILQGHQAREIFVAERSLLLSLDESLPTDFLSIAVKKLRAFFISHKISRAEMDTITISPYTDRRKWEVLKEQIAVAVSSREWNSKATEDWSIADTLKWLRDQNLGQYCLSFKENDIEGRTLLELNEHDLQDLGIRSVGHRKTLMRLVKEIRNSNLKPVDAFDGQPGSVMSIEFKHSPPVPDNHSLKPRQKFPPIQKEPLYLTVMVRGLSESFLKDGNALFDIKNGVFADYTIETFEASPSGILITFKSPMTSSKRVELKEKLMAYLKRDKQYGKVNGELEIDWQKDGKVIHPGPLRIDRMHSLKISYWCEFWEKFVTRGNEEDIFDGEGSKLSAKGAREVLAAVRDVNLNEIEKNDPGIKHLEGLRKSELKTALSNCKLEVKYEIEGKKPVENTTIVKKSESEYGPYWGMYIEGLPRSIIDDRHCIYGIQTLVFKDVRVKRIVVLSEKRPPILKVEFLDRISPKMIPYIAQKLMGHS